MAVFPDFVPPLGLSSGWAMTLYTAWRSPQVWQTQVIEPHPPYQEHIFTGDGEVPLFGWWAVPLQAKGTIVATYGITGSLDNQWFLQILGRKAYAAGYGVVLFDWRGHGRSAQLSATLTSDGLFEGKDFVRIAAQAKALGCPAPFWLVGYSLGGQLALWGLEADRKDWGDVIDLELDDIGGGAVICPSIDSDRSLRYLMAHPLGRYVEKAIAKELQKLAYQLYDNHPNSFDLEVIARADSIWGFDKALVIPRLGFKTVTDYYQASSPLIFLPHLNKPTLILYAADDPLFDPAIIPDLCAACETNSQIQLILTRHGGHVGYVSNRRGQDLAGDRDRWWGWNRVLEWIQSQSSILKG